MNGNTIIKLIAAVLFVVLLSAVILAQTGVFNQQDNGTNDNELYQQQLQAVNGGSCSAGGGGCGCGGAVANAVDTTLSADSNDAITVAENNGVQEVDVSFQNYAYFPNVIKLKKNVPVKMTFDLSTVQGCMRAVQIKALGVSKYLKEGDNIVTFTPQKTGSFPMVCSMGMGKATIVVE